MGTRQGLLYFSVPVIKPWQICVCCYKSSSLLPCQRSHLERNVKKLPQRSTALDLQQNPCIVNTCLDLQRNSWCQQQFYAQCGQYLAPKESFRRWGCIEINQRLMPHWRKTNEQGLWIQWVREMQLQPETSQKNYTWSQRGRARVRERNISPEEGSVMDQIVFIPSTAFLLNYQLSSGPSRIFPHQSNMKYTISAKLSLKPDLISHIHQEGWMQMFKFPCNPLLPSPIWIYGRFTGKVPDCSLKWTQRPNKLCWDLQGQEVA